MSSRLFALLQYALPKHLMSRGIYRLTRSRSRWVRNRTLQVFLHNFNVDMSEAVECDPYAYATFNEFFTRALKPQARPVDSAQDAFVSPVDGTVSQCGSIDGNTMLQAKGQTYSLQRLLGGEVEHAKQYVGGSFATIYLAPYNYHRIHMPYAGTVRHTVYVPGELFSVNAATARKVSNLFARNERVVCEFDSARGPFVMAYIGALHVGSIETTWCGEVNPPPRRRKAPLTLRQGIGTALPKGAEAGRFNMGSTVIVVTPPGFLTWNVNLQAGATVKMGERIATVA